MSTPKFKLGGYPLSKKAKARKVKVRVETLRLALRALEDVHNHAISYSEELLKDAMVTMLEELRGKL